MGAVTDIESAEAFASRLVCNAHDYDAAYPLIRSRDRAVRAAALREAAEWCEGEAVFGRSPYETRWSAEGRDANASAARHFRALAAQEPDDG